MNRLRLIQYSLIHLLVDFACIFFLYRYVTGESTILSLFILYNFCAFALQMPMGLFADWWNRNILFATIGCIVIGIVYLSVLILSPEVRQGGIYEILAVVMIGVGNGMYHVGAGIEVLNNSTKKSRNLGIFISPGAFGIYFGAWLSYRENFSTCLVLALLSVAALSMLFVEVYRNRIRISTNEESKVDYIAKKLVTENVPISFRYPKKLKQLSSICGLFLVVALRSYLGGILAFEWKNAGWGALLVCAFVFGKMVGGFLADGIGTKNASILSLGVSAVLFLFCRVPVAGILAVFFFNMTMPITLWEAARQLHKSKGFAFGLLTFALFLGYLGIDSDVTEKFQYPLGYAFLALVSLLLLWSVIEEKKQAERSRNFDGNNTKTS